MSTYQPLSGALLPTITQIVERVQGHSCQSGECDRLGRVLCHRCAEQGTEVWVCAEHSEKCGHCGQVNCSDCANMHLTFCAKAPDINDEWKTR